MTTVWINGKADNKLDVSDRALAYGDGFFTTMSLKQGKIGLWSLHKKRISLSLSQLNFPAMDLFELELELFELAKSKGEGVLKLIISRGSGGRGYSIAGCNKPMRIVFWMAAPSHYEAYRTSGIELINCQTPISGIPQLAGLKTLNRLEQVLIKQEIEAAGAQEGVVCDLDGNMVECGSANLFWRVGKQVFTPSLAVCGVNGVMRQHIMYLLSSSEFSLSEVFKPIASLELADEIWLTNSLMPILPVKNYNGRYFSDFSLSQHLIKLL